MKQTAVSLILTANSFENTQVAFADSPKKAKNET